VRHDRALDFLIRRWRCVDPPSLEGCRRRRRRGVPKPGVDVLGIDIAQQR